MILNLITLIIVLGWPISGIVNWWLSCHKDGVITLIDIVLILPICVIGGWPLALIVWADSEHCKTVVFSFRR